MDYFGIQRGSIRAQALKKLARSTIGTLSDASVSSFGDNFSRLLGETAENDDQLDGSPKHLSRVAISLKEYEVLNALCDAIVGDDNNVNPMISSQRSEQQVQLLLRKFGLYLKELPAQKFAKSILSGYVNTRASNPSTPSSNTTLGDSEHLGTPPNSPWLELADKLTSAIVALSNCCNKKFLTQSIDILHDFIQTFFHESNDLKMSHYLSLLGFIRALTRNSSILIESKEAFNVFISLDSKIDNPKFLNGVEVYSNANYSAAIDAEFAMEFSPILYIGGMSKLMVGILKEILVSGTTYSGTYDTANGYLTDNIDPFSKDTNSSAPLIDTSVTNSDSIRSTSLLEYILQKVGNEEASSKDPKVVAGGRRSSGDSVPESSGLEISPDHYPLIKILSDIAIQKMEFLDRGETYIVYSTFSRLRIGYLAKSFNLQVIGCGMFTDNVPLKVAKRIFKNCLSIYDVMLDNNLGPSVIQLGALSVYKDDHIGSSLTRAFTSLVANPEFDREYCISASKSVGLASRILSQDAVVTTIYTLANLLFVGGDTGRIRRGRLEELSRVPSSNSMRSLTEPPMSANNNSSMGPAETRPNGDYPNVADASSTINGGVVAHGVSLVANGTPGALSDSDHIQICENSIVSISNIVSACNDETVTTLAVTILSQKMSKPDSRISLILLSGLVSCAPSLPEREFLILMRLLNKLGSEARSAQNYPLFNAIVDAKVTLSRNISQSNPLFYVYLRDMLQQIISKGDVQVLEHHRSHVEINEIGEQIGVFLKPLAALLPDGRANQPKLQIEDTITINLFRNIWFNMVVHGYSITSKIAVKYARELEIIVYNTPPLASELSWDRTETSLELNTVLRRGSSNSNVKGHKHIIGGIFDLPRGMSYPKLMFLSATVFVESLRVKTGDCSTILMYFSDPSIKTSGVDKYIGYTSFKVVKDYIYLVQCGANKQFSSQSIAQQLTNMLALCCHRVEDLQDAALQCCDLLINKVPSALCSSKSLFAIFDLLSLLFQSVVDADKHQYEPTTTYTAAVSKIQLSLSDSYVWRNETFDRFHEKAKNWLRLVLMRANGEIKSLIQSYVAEVDKYEIHQSVQFGVSFALEMAGNISINYKELSNVSQMAISKFKTFPVSLSSFSRRSGLVSDFSDKVTTYTSDYVESAFENVRRRIRRCRVAVNDEKLGDPILKDVPPKSSGPELILLLSDCAGLMAISSQNTAEMVRYLVEIPFNSFDRTVFSAAISIWYSVMRQKDVSVLLLSEIAKRWEQSIEQQVGLFSTVHDLTKPEFSLMEYAPSDRKVVVRSAAIAADSFEPHLLIIRMFSSAFEATLNQSDHILKIFTRVIEFGLKRLGSPGEASTHPFARLSRFEFIRFAFTVLNYHIQLGSRSVHYLSELILNASLSWFKNRASFPFGSNLLKIKADFALLKEVAKLVNGMETYKSDNLESRKALLLFFLDDEIAKIAVWLNPLGTPQDTHGTFISNHISGSHISQAYKIDPSLAVSLALRYKVKNLDELLQKLISSNPLPAIFYPDAVQYFIGINAGSAMPSYHLLFWEPLSPIDSITLFLPPFGSNPYILQYTMRSLESHDVNLTFFYVPQIVQSLRFDAKGYVERFIVETAQVSQLFAHQIIWNMLANSYRDEESTDPDPLKPTLDNIQEIMIKSFSPKDLDFYEKEFTFFENVTSISGKLKPYIKKTKAEKKVKIDSEMAKIEIQPGVYLPSNPDGVVIDINRKSGKPLQSHAKAPFLATFKIRKEVLDVDKNGNIIHFPLEKWQSAIFKVGDDCRQDVLALQLVSVFRTIWENAGLDLYVFPYRVTATAPGCGVIDVLPNSVSRDMLGREAVNGLYEYFTTKFGPDTSIEFQQARNNLIKSLAAYSIISYLLQFKDRHNGNIMYDEQGHILHIDFGFCFDIVPGGVRFEMAPFKLTHEMILVLGGSSNTQAFQWFEELCVKGYLACRPYMETIVRCVNPMLESGLPCFKDTTIKKLRSRFVPSKSEKDASIHMRGLVKKSMESMYTKGYDEFQRITNGIPY
ncbi:phosphatidylinositol 4-kinase Stt4p [[Candida] anglica]|uniref:1-phosphatidylinositol 4-kinase n=1 Tax=[Candida] anglica TaxID=148631 RepID=A0ABP0EK33_9ASCO